MINPPNRISREQMLLEIAYIVARRGTCGRLSVGAVVARNSRAISIGYVGAPAGEPHCSPEVCDVSRPCTRTVHAEQNALMFALRQGVDVVGADMFVTHSPCVDCARVIWLTGVSRVFYGEEYRDDAGVKFLLNHGVQVFEVDRAPKE